MRQRLVILIIMLFGSGAASAMISFRDAAAFVRDAEIVAVVSIVSIEPHHSFPGYDVTCGFTVTARVSDALKGVEEDQIVQFGVSDPLKYRTSYLVALERSSSIPFSGRIILIPDEKSADEAEELRDACIATLPELKDVWPFRSEMVSSDWIPLGYKVFFAEDSSVEVIGIRISEVAIDRFGDEEIQTTLERYDDASVEPWSKTLLPEEVEHPTEFVNWDSFREYIIQAVASQAAVK